MIHISITYGTHLLPSEKKKIIEGTRDFLASFDENHFFRICLEKDVCHIGFLEEKEYYVIGTKKPKRRSTVTLLVQVTYHEGREGSGYYFNSEGLIACLKEILKPFFDTVIVT